MAKTVKSEDIRERQETVYYIFCPHCAEEIDSHDRTIAGYIDCPHCGKAIKIGSWR